MSDFRFQDGRDWFFSHRLGLFIHWGIYAVDRWHEQDQYRHRRLRSEYERLKERFNPSRFDPDRWLDLAAEAGMRYLCFTTKHVDGFCMWDTRATDYNVMHTPFGKDVLALVADACHRRDIPLCLYYSLADMHHPNYPNAGRAYECPGPQPGDEPDLPKYIEFVKAQVRELCTRYGKIHGFWWDANVLKHQDPSINAIIRELQPGIVVNNRGCDDGDFGTPERDWDESVNAVAAFQKPIEACQALGHQSWGYRWEEDYYTEKHILRSMANMLAKGGNYLLNTGPRPDGDIAEEDTRFLRAIGRWRQAVWEAFDGTTFCPELVASRDFLTTRRGHTVYAILHKEPVTRAVYLKPIARLPRRATLLNDGRPLETRCELLPNDHLEAKAYLRVYDLPQDALNATVPVVRLEFDADPSAV